MERSEKSKVKSYYFGHELKKSTKLLKFAKYSYFIRKIPTKAHVEGNSFLYPIVQELEPIDQWFKRYGFIHYRSSSEVNKRTLSSKGHKMRMKNDFDMEPKTLVRGLSKVSKKSKDTSIPQNLKEKDLVKVRLF